jgi:hypothetical protein
MLGRVVAMIVRACEGVFSPTYKAYADNEPMVASLIELTVRADS